MNIEIVIPLILIIMGSAGWAFVFQWQVKNVSAEKVSWLSLSRTTLMMLPIWIPSTMGLVFGVVYLFDIYHQQWYTPFFIFGMCYALVSIVVTFAYLGQLPQAGQIVGTILTVLAVVVSFVWR